MSRGRGDATTGQANPKCLRPSAQEPLDCARLDSAPPAVERPVLGRPGYEPAASTQRAFEQRELEHGLRLRWRAAGLHCGALQAEKFPTSPVAGAMSRISCSNSMPTSCVNRRDQLPANVRVTPRPTPRCRRHPHLQPRPNWGHRGARSASLHRINAEHVSPAATRIASRMSDRRALPLPKGGDDR